MITGGLDLGAGSVKGALMEDGRRVLARSILPTRGNLVEAAHQVLDQLAEEANISPGDVEYLCTTGFGRYMLPERQLQVSDFTSSARGALYLFPGTRHVVDIGTQSSRTMAIGPSGKVLKFKMNEKCAGRRRALRRAELEVPSGPARPDGAHVARLRPPEAHLERLRGPRGDGDHQQHRRRGPAARTS